MQVNMQDRHPSQRVQPEVKLKLVIGCDSLVANFRDSCDLLIRHWYIGAVWRFACVCVCFILDSLISPLTNRWGPNTKSGLSELKITERRKSPKRNKPLLKRRKSSKGDRGLHWVRLIYITPNWTYSNWLLPVRQLNSANFIALKLARKKNQ